MEKEKSVEIPSCIRDYLAKPDKTIGEHADELVKQAEILREMGYIRNEHMFFLLREACLHHDDGKANPEFACRVRDKKRKFNPEKEVAHNILSLYYLNPDAYSVEDYEKIACAVLYHHDYCDEAEVISEQKELIESLLLKNYSYRPKRRSLNRIVGTCLVEPETIMLKGLLHRCDYSASGEYQVEYPSNFLQNALEKMMQRWQEKNSQSRWNNLQEFTMTHREDDIIAIAPTGMGKTEAGLLWIGDAKGFFILPVRTAINAIYDRIRTEILRGEKLEERLGLLHSEALEYYSSHVQELDILEYRNRGKNLSLPLNISTMDQLFDFVLKYKGYEMKLATLSYSKIVIDEIQMYGSDLLAYLVCGLRQIHMLGGKIAIVTATLSPFLRDILRQDAGISFVEEAFTSDMIRHSVCVKEKSLAVEDIIECYQRNKAAGCGNKILVVCNTIRKAQKVYRELRELLFEEEEYLHIFHSRFVRSDRRELEGEIKEFGETYVKGQSDKILDIKDGIWVCTSLVEVSLDIDFDYLFTELSELNALFQRMGRCNRKGVKMVTGYNCFVYCDGADIKRGRKGYIDETFYRCSFEALKGIDGLLSEEDKVKMLEDFFTSEKLKDSAFVAEYRDVFTTFCKIEVGRFTNKDKIRNIMTKLIIPRPVYDQNEEVIRDLERELRAVEQNLMTDNMADSGMKNRLIETYISAQEKLRDFIVAIPEYEYRNYIKRSWESFGSVKVSKYEEIPVMDCHYDETGYYPLNYDDRTVMDEIMML